MNLIIMKTTKITAGISLVPMNSVSSGLDTSHLMFITGLQYKSRYFHFIDK